ncbi:potassium transport protein TRK1/TRK2 [Westerdykella ornata]|uniref:Potassium transport protein n=1 Tax=Westerdykella ornata TaxID=318751 RepID=A0A6A6JJ56_WESOR|nr:potassium transport protein TRK1/TRK2 [Westerdykella ornata]KAF2276492.1 potassium transport protein TRK1/TRK2 [Westerdykella ornata]
MFGPWIATFSWLKRRLPTGKKGWKTWIPSMNFITIHYTYIIGMALLGSIIIYPAGNMAYIDALFFASGAATQSGLNTIDLNNIRLYQQVAIMLITCCCTPIFINTFVVFVRLYWFEKRFQSVVVEARSLRKTKTRSRTRSEARQDLERDIGREERGVGNRTIVVQRNADGSAMGRKIDEETSLEGSGSSAFESKGDAQDKDEGQLSPRTQSRPGIQRDITFADELERKASPEIRLPQQRSKEQSIAFVQNQRNPQDTGALRIPGPRDYDRGFMPERIEEGDEELDRETTNEDDGGRYLRRARSNSVPPHELNMDDHPFKQHITIDAPDGRIRPNTGPSAYSRAPRSSDAEGPSTGMYLRNRSRSRTFGSFISRSLTEERERDPMPYLSWTPTVGRNSAFIDLTEEQREELGGIEYRSLKLLAIILVCYYIGFHLLGMVCLLPWIVRDRHYSDIVSGDGVNPVWWGFFTPASMFNDLGFALTPDSMISFQLAVLPLILGVFLIVIGNTGFPCMLRFVVWLCSKCVPEGSGVWEELRFLLDHPRRCFTLLFPSNANWWLFWVLILLNGIDVIIFLVLDLHNPVVTSIPGGFRFLDGLFQAASTRTAGFAVVNIAELHPATQVSYLIMMYISVFPIAISLRRTNVYEEKSLGVWGNQNDDDEGSSGKHSYVGMHLRRQLSFDLWYVFLGFFLIAIIEGTRLQNTNDYTFTLFSVLFEIVSAYGTVGLSLGYPGVNASFSSQFKPLSKLIIIAMQIRGRHRGLPYALDRAILLPSETLHKKEDEDAARRARRGSVAVSNVEVPAPNGAAVGGSTGEAASAAGDAQADLARVGTGATVGRRASGLGVSMQRSRSFGRFLSGALYAGPMPREREREREKGA